jgi:hypothetical protein
MRQILDDLNTYGECQIPVGWCRIHPLPICVFKDSQDSLYSCLLVDDANTVNLKLFPTFVDPPQVLDHQVPLLLVNLSEEMSEEWDMTMERV